MNDMNTNDKNENRRSGQSRLDIGVLMKSKLSSVKWRLHKATEYIIAPIARLFGGQAEQFTQIVICGYPRSGTSLLYNMFSSSLSQFEFDEFEVSASSSLWKRESHVSKLPLDILKVPDLIDSNIHRKRLFFVIPLRDIRDLITSVHPIVTNEYYMGYDSSITRSKDGVISNRPYGIKQIHEKIKNANESFSERVVSMRYEDLVSEPDRVQNDLAGALGIEFSQCFSRFHEVPTAHAFNYSRVYSERSSDEFKENTAVTAARVGKWRNPKHANRIREQFLSHPELFSILEETGYEVNRDWFRDYEEEAMS